MTELHDLLEIASRPASVDEAATTHDFGADLHLGRRALTRRRLAAAGGGVAAAGLVAGSLVGAAALFGGPGQAATPASSTSSTSSPPATSSATAEPNSGTLIEADQTVGPFHFTQRIAGYVQAQTGRQGAVLFLPDEGGVEADSMGPWKGKVVVALLNAEKDPITDGDAGNTSSIVRTLMVSGTARTLWVRVPAEAGLTPVELHDFAASIEVLRIP